MNESAAPPVDVPAASSTASDPSRVHYESSDQRLTIWLNTDVLDDTLDAVSEALGPDGSDALDVEVDGTTVRADALRAMLRFITQDCDRAVRTVQLRPAARDALLAEALGRPAECISASVGPVLTTAPPVRPVLGLAGRETEAPEQAPLPFPPQQTAPPEQLPDGSSPASESDEVAAQGEVQAVPDADGSAPTPAGAAEPAAEAADSSAPDSESSEVALEQNDGTASPPAEAELPTEQLRSESFLADLDKLSAPVDTTETGDVPHSRSWGRTQDADRRVLALRRTVRSGKSVRFAGDVVIFGDVNDGAQVFADGDIVVLGRLRGLAHAGHRGDNTAVVLGLDMQSGQIRIGDTIAFPRPAVHSAGTTRIAALLRRSSPTPPHRSVSPSFARVVDGEIRIEDYRGRLND